MERDLMLIAETEDIDDIQEFFENRHHIYEEPQGLNRLYYERDLDYWDAYILMEGYDEKEKISNRQRAIRRISKILEETSSYEQESSVGETK